MRPGVDAGRLVGFARVAESMMRGNRECQISMLMLLTELALDGELSSMALDRRLHKRGIKNVRMLLHMAQSRHERLIACRFDAHGDGRFWHLTQAGYDVLERAMKRAGL